MTRQLRFTASDFVAENETGIDDAVLDPNDPINEMRTLAGIGSSNKLLKTYESQQNISHTANEKAELMRKHNIQPGTQEWFRLWFSLPYLTNEKPIAPADKE